MIVPSQSSTTNGPIPRDRRLDWLQQADAWTELRAILINAGDGDMDHRRRSQYTEPPQTHFAREHPLNEQVNLIELQLGRSQRVVTVQARDLAPKLFRVPAIGTIHVRHPERGEDKTRPSRQ
ncbi:MAG: hypothetical protein HY763_08850 [Planctomycetes bacterium]|nr:hypothetical protein [Planctomycetota bacterium]